MVSTYFDSAIAVLSAMFLLSCSKPLPRSDDSRDVHGIAPASAVGREAPSVSNPNADSQFVRFLSLSVATRASREGMLDSVYTCREDENLLQARWVADYRVLSVMTRGDTGEAVAVITTVVRQFAGERDGYLGVLSISEDTGTWKLIREAPGAPWKVCGDEVKSGFGLFLNGNIRKWEPSGASAKQAFDLVDSIRRARGLGIVR